MNTRWRTPFFPILAPVLLAAAPLPVLAQDAGNLTYVAVRGDTLYTLARRYMIDTHATAEVQRINRMRNANFLPVGAQLIIPRRLLRSVPVELRVASFSGPVSLGGGAVSVQAGQVIAEGAELMTGPGAFVTLSGSDGSRFSLPSQSAVRVNTSRRYLINGAATIDMEILRGRMVIKAARQKPGDTFRLRTPGTVTAVRGTEFRVGYEAQRSTGFTEVLEGKVAVNTARATLDLEQGFGAAASADGALTRERLLAPPEAIAPGKVQTEADLEFAFKPLADAQSYRVQVARDVSFLDIISESLSAEPRASLPGVANGRLFMRASAIAASGIEGMPETWSFRRQRVGLKADAGQAGVPDGFRFNWLAEGEGTPAYRFQLFRDGEPARPLVDEAGMTQTGMTITGLARGAYHWRVGVLQTTADGTAEVWTALQKFTVTD